MAAKVLGLTVLFWMLTACRQDQLSLPVAQAAGSDSPTYSSPSEAAGPPLATPVPQLIRQPKPGESCYAFILLRPREQRADAVQVRLQQADKMSAALDSRTISVDLIGDHANILSFLFPVTWPANPKYARRVSTIVERYFADPDVEDDLCNAGFAQVRLSARGLNDHRIHPLWSARVTSEGLLKVVADGQVLDAMDQLSPTWREP